MKKEFKSMKASTTSIRISTALLERLKGLQQEWITNNGYHISYELIIRQLLSKEER